MGCIWELLGEALQDNGPFMSFQAETSNQSRCQRAAWICHWDCHREARRDQPMAILMYRSWLLLVVNILLRMVNINGYYMVNDG